MNEILKITGLPILTGLIFLLIPENREKIRFIKGLLALAVCLVSGVFSFVLYYSGNKLVALTDITPSLRLNFFGADLVDDISRFASFNLDDLSKLIIIFISLFALLLILYSLVRLNSEKISNFFDYFLITLGASYGAVFSNNLLLFVIFWGILAITLYKLIGGQSEESSAAAEKTLIIVGASDGIIILGIAIIWKITHTLSMADISLSTNSILAIIAFLALLTGSFTKAGAFPLHTWLPDYTQHAPAQSSAFLPASLDKLLGIYFLARITTHLFEMNEWLKLIFLIIGGVTIITAVMMALVQHNYKRLLGYHSVSQVGYMVVGFGLGSMIGIAAGLFHMINNTLYKSGLFLVSGNVAYRTGREDIDDLGGLSGAMPVTFFTCLIFALSISGIPPFNGFASKWMIYQGIVDLGTSPGVVGKLWFIWLGLTVLGSALTLASFIKFIGGIFLGRKRAEFDRVKEVPFLMWLPLVILAVFCVAFGVLASDYIVPKLFMPISGEFKFLGTWNSLLVSILVLVSIGLGILIYLIGNIRNFRTVESFIGGEKLQEMTNYHTTEFYKTIEEFRLFSWFYRVAERKWFDIYVLLKKCTLWFSNLFSRAHTGLLPDYAVWILAGLIIILIIVI